ncbi:MAG: sigma-54-dependent Fis family transcriptional regulator [Candidatus Rokubacteria bacterium]|nr:sigma-54-dependent Fis family transcriptional regulator [Candidatus Rokubacteria bacterium]
MAKILIIDDDPMVRSVLSDILLTEGLEADVTADGKTGIERVRESRPEVVLLDLTMPGMAGLDVLPELKRIDPQIAVIILTASHDVSTAVKAIRLGAYDYLTKPCGSAELLVVIRRAVERQELLARVDDLASRVGHAGLADQMGRSAQISDVIRQVNQVAESTITVLIQGETGSGKELIARAIHQTSPRRAGPFIALDCGAIPDTLIESELFGYERGAFSGADRHKDGHFQLAAGGTLFLDEIVNLPPATQSKLLRVLQERQVQPLGARGPVPVDVRIVAASNTLLDVEMRAGRFRQDLYYRLAEYTIALPPLRERRDDILPLARRFLAEAAMELRRPVRAISPPAADVLLAHTWPGNVRELRNVIRQAALRSRDVLEVEDLTLGRAIARSPRAESPTEALSLREAAQLAAAEAEQRAIRHALEVSEGNKAEAARLLRTDYKTLHLKMKQYGISSRQFLAP